LKLVAITNIQALVKIEPPDSGSRRWIWSLLLGWCFTGICLLAGVDSTQTQARLPSLFSGNLSYTEYYTNNLQLKYRLTYKKATPLGPERYLVSHLHLELFEETGQRQMAIEAPECFYDFKAHSANSPGPLKIILGAGRLSVTGEGFLWQQTDSSLIISNRVKALVRELPNIKSKP
jgi:hypothetical protein